MLQDIFHQPNNDLPDHWDSTELLYDKNQYGGVQMPRIVPATSSAKKNGTAGMDPFDIKLWQVAFEGKHNYMLRQLANGRWTQFQGHKSLPDAVFHMKLSTFIRNRNIRIETIAVNYWKWKNGTEMLPSEAQRKEAMEMLVANIGDLLMRYNNPPAVQPQVRAQLAQKEAEIAGLRAQLASQSRKTPFPQGIIPPTQTQMPNFFETGTSKTSPSSGKQPHPHRDPCAQDNTHDLVQVIDADDTQVSQPIASEVAEQAPQPPPPLHPHPPTVEDELDPNLIGGITTPSYQPSPRSPGTGEPASSRPFESPGGRQNKVLLDIVNAFDDEELIQYLSGIAPQREPGDKAKMDKIRQVHELTSSLSRYAAPSATTWISTLKMSGPKLQAQKEIAKRLTVYAEAHPKDQAYQDMVKAWSLPKLTNTAGTAAVAIVVAGLASYLH